MNSQYLQQLANSIRIKFGTSSSEPTQYQLEKIIQDIDNIRKSGSHPSNSDWQKIVKLRCPSTGNYIYKGLDNSDLNTLLEMAKK
jgi:hypothetical protein